MKHPPPSIVKEVIKTAGYPQTAIESFIDGIIKRRKSPVKLAQYSCFDPSLNMCRGDIIGEWIFDQKELTTTKLTFSPEANRILPFPLISYYWNPDNSFAIVEYWFGVRNGRGGYFEVSKDNQLLLDIDRSWDS